MTIDNCHDFHTSAMGGRSDLVATSLDRGKDGVDIGFRLFKPYIHSSVCLQDQQIQHAALCCGTFVDSGDAPLCSSNRTAAIVLLHTRIENPEHGFENLASGRRLAARFTERNMFLRKMFPDALSIVR